MVFGSSFFKKVFLSKLFIVSAIAAAQEKEAESKLIEQRIEYLIEEGGMTEADFTSVFDRLYYYAKNPLNLNRAKREDLDDLGLLTTIQTSNLLTHISKNGKLIALEELQTVEDFDINTIQRIFPFVVVSKTVDTPHLSFRQLLQNGENTIIVRAQRVLEDRKGYSTIADSSISHATNRRYLGNPAKLYTRYRYNYRQYLSFGITSEKDAGEEFFTGTQKNGFDFYSAHLFLRNLGKVKHLAIGDFQAQFGQGLTYWSGLAYGRSADIISIKRNAVGLRPYTSVEENRFLRGIGFTMQHKRMEWTNFYSRNSIDANLGVDTLGATSSFITSLKNNGLHRTYDEVEGKDGVVQRQMGTHLAYKTHGLNVGITSVYSNLNKDYRPNVKSHNHFASVSNGQVIYGADYSWVHRNFNFFGELSKSDGAGMAFLSGTLIALDPKLSTTILYRNYQRDFQPISSSAIGENTNNVNERGLYVGTTMIVGNKIKLSGYYDNYAFPWLKHDTDAPSKGYQYLMQWTYKPSKHLDMYFRLRKRSKYKNSKEDTEGLHSLSEEKKTDYRFHINFKVSEKIRLKSRVEWTNYFSHGLLLEEGYLIYQDVIFKSKKSPFSFSFRYAIFDTDDYASRIYAYENDVLYAFSVPAFYDQGTRAYLVFRWQALRGLDVWLRYGLTHYDNRNVISSGLEEVQGNRLSEVKAQVRFKF